MEKITLNEFRRILEGVPGCEWKVKQGLKFYTVMLPPENYPVEALKPGRS